LDLLISVTGIADASAIQLSWTPRRCRPGSGAPYPGLIRAKSSSSANKKPPLREAAPLPAYRPLYARSERCTPWSQFTAYSTTSAHRETRI